MDLFTTLGTLEAAGLIQVAKVEPDLEYLFRHSMVQDAAYASLLESDRRKLHLAVGDAIEKLYPDRNKELAAILGYHFKEAGQDDRALSYFKIAGDEALAVYANQEAEIQYRRALELKCCTGLEIAGLYSGLGEALYRQSRFEEAVQAYHKGIEIYNSQDDKDNIARLYARVGRVEWFADKRPKGLETCLEGLELVKGAPDSKEIANLIHETARAYFFNGKSKQALPMCRKALALAKKFNALYVQADALATLGILAGVEADESLKALQEAIDLAEANGFLQVAMRAHINLGTMTRAWLADNDTALKHFRRSAELGRMRGVASEEFLGVTSYVSCLFAPGRLKEIEAELPHMDELVGQIASPAPMQGTLKFIRGVLAGYRGDWDKYISICWDLMKEIHEQKSQEAINNMLDELSWIILEKQRWGEPADLDQIDALLEEALSYADVKSIHEWLWIYPRLSVLRARQGRLSEAQEWLEKFRVAVSTRPSAWDNRFIGECEIEISTARQDWNKAIDEVEKLSKIEHDQGFRVASTRSLLRWADLLVKRVKPGDLENARALLVRAINEFKDMGVGHYPEIAQDLLKDIQNKLHSQALDHEQLTRELKKARLVQESLLPANPPELPGWDIAATLVPAHETSGDFYDYLFLPDGSLGLVIADVTDKGTSAALYMALSRSLWRTYAVNHPGMPELTIIDTNRRILADTHGGLYITLLYGILNPLDGQFTYCSAGHHPAYLLRAADRTIERLESTGVPLGVMDETTWKQSSVNLAVGDVLVLYTDGITDAENLAEDAYGFDRLCESLQEQLGKPARQVRDALLADVRKWVGSAPQFDDITLMVIVRAK